MRTSRFTLHAAVLACVVAALATAGPARAGSGFANLTAEGTLGSVRAHPVAQLSTGETVDITGNPHDELTNPNRTVGDVELGVGPACGGINPECFRYLATNDAAINASASDGHTHYHAGDRTLIVNEIALFAPGDTIMIGSPSCDFERLGLICKRYLAGIGMVSDQPRGEIAVVKSAARFDHGPGMIELTGGLARVHADGEQVAKLATAYPGQQLRIDIPNRALYTDEQINVRADFIPPQGSHDPTFPRRPLTLAYGSNAIEQPVGGPGGVTSFFVPREIMSTQTIGSTFDVGTPDTWYTIVVTGKTTPGRLAAHGVFRFKLNPIAITSLTVDFPTAAPTQAVTIVGSLRDNIAAPALTRPVEDVQIDVVVMKPSGTRSFRVRSCFDSDPGPEDMCGGGSDDIFQSQPVHHGDFQARIGGTGPLYVDPDKPGDATCLDRLDRCAANMLTSMGDTAQPGDYDVTATTRLISPPASRATQFTVAL